MSAPDGLTSDFWKDGRFGTKSQGRERVLFGQTRDDVEVERRLIERQGGVRRALVITSGGCAALTLLDVVTDEILSVDINPAQNRLAELKFAAWRESSAVFERMTCGDGRQAYRSLRSGLPAPLARYWDYHLTDLRRGLLHCGRLDGFSHLMRTLFFATVHDRQWVEAFLQLDDPAQQEAVFEKDWDTRRWRAALAVGFNPLLLRLTFSRRAATLLPKDFAHILGGRLRRWLTSHPARSNPYLWQSFLGRHPPERCHWPRYFWDQYREAALGQTDKVRFLDANVTEVLTAQKTGSLDFISLSNVLELAPDPDVVLQAASHALRPGGLLLSRSILPSRPVMTHGWSGQNDLFAEASALDRGGLSLPAFLMSRL